jgi:hypothetical protein
MKAVQGGIPPQISEVRIARRRGGQPGNINRRKHGAFSRAASEERNRIARLIRVAESLIVRVHMVAKARTALRRKQKNTLAPAGGEGRVRGTVSPHHIRQTFSLLHHPLTPTLSPTCVGAREKSWDSARDPPWCHA